MRWIIPAIVAALLLQSTALPIWLRPGVVPDLVLVLITLFAGLRGWRQGLIAGLVGAVMESVVSVAPLGVHLVRLSAVGVAAGVMGRGFERSTPLLAPALVALATLGGTVLVTLSLQATGRIVLFTGLSASEIVFQMLINAALGIGVLPVLRYLVARRTSPDGVLV